MKIKVFVDTSIFVEMFKGNLVAREIMDVLLTKDNTMLCTSVSCIEEIIYVSKKYKLNVKEILDFIEDNLYVLDISMETYRLFKSFVLKYDIGSVADLLHLATCKHHNIKYLATLDEDFIKPAKKEKITLLMSKKDVEKI